MMTLKMTALTRIVSRDAHIPATTAIGSLHGRDERPRALAAGANVLMPNFTPTPYRRQYEIYPNKRCVNEDAGACPTCMAPMVAALGRWLDYSRGDTMGRLFPRRFVESETSGRFGRSATASVLT